MNNLLNLVWVKKNAAVNTSNFELWNGKEQVLSLELNQFSHTAKLACLQSRRIFKIEKEGFLRNNTILKNEYGVKIGSINHENWFTHEGLIDINSQRFMYSYTRQNRNEVTIFSERPKQALLVCDITATKKEMIDFDNIEDSNAKNVTFLMALAWFLYLPASSASAFGSKVEIFEKNYLVA